MLLITKQRKFKGLLFSKIAKTTNVTVIADEYLVDAVIGEITGESIAGTMRSSQHSDANSLHAYLNMMGVLPNFRPTECIKQNKQGTSTTNRDQFY